jgi:hypothetical protein
MKKKARVHWHVHGASAVVPLKERQVWIKEMLNSISNDDPMIYTMSGDTCILVHKTEDGIEVMEMEPRRSGWVEIIKA